MTFISTIGLDNSDSESSQDLLIDTDFVVNTTANPPILLIDQICSKDSIPEASTPPEGSFFERCFVQLNLEDNFWSDARSFQWKANLTKAWAYAGPWIYCAICIAAFVAIGFFFPAYVPAATIAILLTLEPVINYFQRVDQIDLPILEKNAQKLNAIREIYDRIQEESNDKLNPLRARKQYWVNEGTRLAKELEERRDAIKELKKSEMAAKAAAEQASAPAQDPSLPIGEPQDPTSPVLSDEGETTTDALPENEPKAIAPTTKTINDLREEAVTILRENRLAKIYAAFIKAVLREAKNGQHFMGTEVDACEICDVDLRERGLKIELGDDDANIFVKLKNGDSLTYLTVDNFSYKALSHAFVLFPSPAPVELDEEDAS